MAIDAHVAATLERGREASADIGAASHVPYTRFLDRGILATKNGDLVVVIALDGVPSGLHSIDAAERARDAIARVIRQVGDGYTLVYTHSIRMRRTSEGLLEPVPGTGFDAAVDARYRAHLDASALYEMRHYLTLVRRPVMAVRGLAAGALAALAGAFLARSYRRQDDEETIAEARRRAMQALEAAATIAVTELQRFGARRLEGSREDRRTILTFLSMLASGIWQDQPVVRFGLDRMLGTGRLVFAGETVRIAGPAPGQDRWVAMLAVQEYDEATAPGLFDGLLSEAVEVVVSQGYQPLDRIGSQGVARDRARAMRDAGDEAASVRAALAEAVDDVAAGRIVLGRHHLTIAVIAREAPELERALARATSAMGGAGLKWRREDIGLEAAWWAQLPGNVGYQARSEHRLVSNVNAADFAPFFAEPQGERENLPWGAPVTVLPTLARTALHFSFHGRGANANGNTLLFGPTGSGKTALAGFLLAQTRRLPRPPRIVYFDKDRGAETMIRALGGAYLRLGPAAGTRFNPFERVHDEAGAAWLAGFVERLAAGEPLAPEQRRRLEVAARRSARAANLRRVHGIAAIGRRRGRHAAARAAARVGRGRRTGLALRQPVRHARHLGARVRHRHDGAAGQRAHPLGGPRLPVLPDRAPAGGRLSDAGLP